MNQIFKEIIRENVDEVLRMNQIFKEIIRENVENAIYIQSEKISLYHIDKFLQDLHFLKGMLEYNKVTNTDQKIIEQLDSIIEKYKNVRRNKE